MAEPLARPAARPHHGLTAPIRSPPGPPKRPPNPPTPAQEPPDTPQNRQRQIKHAREQPVETRADNRCTRHSTGGSTLRVGPGGLLRQPVAVEGEEYGS